MKLTDLLPIVGWISSYCYSIDLHIVI